MTIAYDGAGVIVFHRSLLLTLLFGCGNHRAAVPAPIQGSASESLDASPTSRTPDGGASDSVAVRVQDSAEAPVANAVVTLSIAEEADKPLVRITDVHGRTQIGPVSTTGTLTAMTSSGFATTSVDGNHVRAPLLLLDTHCSRFRGLVTDQSALSAKPTIEIIHIFRYGIPSAPAFSAKVDDDGRFQGCLPDGRYYADSELEEVGGGVLFELPGGDTIEYVATRDTAAKLPPPTHRSSLTSLKVAVRDIPASASVIALGESTHGTSEFALERARFTVELARTRKVRFILLEAGFGETLALDRYVRTGAGDVRKAVAALRFWMWDTEQFIESVELIREFNRKRPSKERIGFLGTDVQMAGGAVAFLLEHERKTLTDEDRDALRQVPDLDTSTWDALEDATRQHVREVLTRLATPRFPGDMRGLAAASIIARLDEIVTGPELEQMRVRDRLMADMTLRISDNGNNICVVWAHMVHVTKRWMLGQETMGGRLHAQLGSKFFALAMLGQSGSARTWDAHRKIGVIPHVLEEAPAYSIESALSTGESGAQYVLFARVEPALRDWLSKLRYVRFIGSTFPDAGGGWTLYDMGHGFDGAVVFRSTSATTPTPTGIRKATPP